MISYKSFVVGKKARISPMGSTFSTLIRYDGTNIDEIEDAITKENIGGIQIKPSDISKKKNSSEFIRCIISGTEYQYIFLNKGDLIAIKQKEIMIFNDEYVEQFFDLNFDTNTISIKKTI